MVTSDPASIDPSVSPLLGVRNRALTRSSSLPDVQSPVKKSAASQETSDVTIHGPHVHTYISPVVLRKELERHLKQEKEILSPKFVESSKDLFWNMVSVWSMFTCLCTC